MSKEPFVSPTPADRTATPSLEDLLAARAPASLPQVAPLGKPPPDLPASAPLYGGAAHAGAAHAGEAPAPPAADSGSDLSGLRVPLLLVHAGFSEGALIHTWMQHVMKGSSLYLARFQEAVTDLVLDHQPYAVLIQFDPCCIDAAVALSAQLQQHYPQIPRLAIGRTRHAQCVLAALRTGVQDFLDIDGSVDTAQQVVRHLLSSPPSAGLHISRAPQTAIISARAGLGCSLLAAHLGTHLQARLQQPAHPAGDALSTDAKGVTQEALASLLIELGHPGGDCAIYLDTPGEFGFADAVHQQRRLDRRMAQSAIARHASGLRLLTLARAPHDCPSSEVQALLNRLGHYFRHIVLDLGACQSPQMLKDVLPSASEIWVVCDQSVASVVGTAELLQQLQQLAVPRERLRLIVGRHDRRLELSAQQIARQLQLPLLAQLPERRRELAEVVNQGLLFPAQRRREPYVQAVAQLVDHLLADHHPETAQPRAASATPLARLLQRLRNHAP
ncbi:AAA family ATPase [Comamonas endophytica]|uniref:Pilus assembly protein CpaE n=1 Tax=Comamonas endophytica TaxID=2949090 RepID=A0ABY6GAN4_9BURK|nr:MULTISPECIES: pilus assembly protein CpaE [unclassified Acidovorax]MCD2512150.1 pilus assembly protein CpaE [Acidovorax sp. D4N7]UYG51923.1 pilus assembly protein CpaE [Acidovorax sp. 5MLIR]